MKAVITADLIDSSNMLHKDEVINSLQNQLEFWHCHHQLDYEFYRGDSFQLLCPAKEAILYFFLLKSLVQINDSDARFSIGIGPIEHPKDNISLADGTAFRISGRGLEKIKEEELNFIIACTNEQINQELRLSCFLMEPIMNDWSTKSAEVIYLALLEKTQQQIAAKIEISQSAVQQRLKSAHWDAVKLFIKRYRQIINLLTE